jgi:hypothetical protein
VSQVLPDRVLERVGPPAPHILASELDGDISLYDPVRSNVHVLNSTASDVWRLLDGEHTLDEVVEMMARSYEVDRSDIRAHVARTIDVFTDRGLLSRARS